MNLGDTTIYVPHVAESLTFFKSAFGLSRRFLQVIPADIQKAALLNSVCCAPVPVTSNERKTRSIAQRLDFTPTANIPTQPASRW